MADDSDEGQQNYSSTKKPWVKAVRYRRVGKSICGVSPLHLGEQLYFVFLFNINNINLKNHDQWVVIRI